MATAEIPGPRRQSDGAKPIDRREVIRHAFGDFRAFCGLLKIRKKGISGEDARRWPMLLTQIQRAYCVERTSRDIILKPRQVYMTTLECARDLWWFSTKPGARVVVVVQSQTDQAALKDVSEKFRIFFDSLQGFGVRYDFGRNSTTEWTLPKRDATMRLIQAGASEVSAEKKGRGGTINRLHLSEAAFYDRASDTFNSLQESVPREGSEVVNESTPNGAAGFYFEQWKAAVDGRSAYTPHFFPWWIHPEYLMPLADGEAFEPQTELEARLLLQGVPIECLNWYRWKIRDKGGDARLVAQEFPSDPESCFLDSEYQYIQTDYINAAILAGPMPLVDGYIYAGLDVGRTNDLTVLTIIKKTFDGHMYVCAQLTCKRTEYDEQIAMVLNADAEWCFSHLCVDATGIGSMPAETLQKAMGMQRVEPIVFSAQSKELMATALHQAFAQRALSIPDDPDLKTDVASIRRIITDKGNVVYDAPRTDQGHADKAWSLALAILASQPMPGTGRRTEYGYGDFRGTQCAR